MTTPTTHAARLLAVTSEGSVPHWFLADSAAVLELVVGGVRSHANTAGLVLVDSTAGAPDPPTGQPEIVMTAHPDNFKLVVLDLRTSTADGVETVTRWVAP